MATSTLKVAVEGKYSAKLEIDKGQIAKSAALGVGNYFVKGISMGYYAVEGAVKNESDNRFKSSAKSVYENSPFAYVEKGQDIEIKVNDIFGLKFDVDNEDEENEKETTPGKYQEGNFEYEIKSNEN